MEYQEIINVLENISNQPSTFRIEKWIEINDHSVCTYNTNSDTRFRTTMLKSILRDYSDSYILINGKITIKWAGNDAAARRVDERNKGVISKKVLHLLIVRVK